MALYGFSVFLETPEHLRKGRKRYITASFVITILSTLSASLDMSSYFQVLFQSTSGRHWQKLFAESDSKWDTQVSFAAMGCLLLIGDALLVSIVSWFRIARWLTDRMPQVYRCYMMFIEHGWVTILPGLTSLAAVGTSCFSGTRKL